MLALLERCVTEPGGIYAFCDTDSMAIIATETGGLVRCPAGSETLPDGTPAVRTLSWAQVDAIVERFEALNPYDKAVVPGSIHKIEKENFSDGDRRQLYAYAIAAKRYALFNLGADGSVKLRKQSEHGLGHLLNPTDPENPSRAWIEELWQYLISEALGRPIAPPPWLDRPAVSRLTVSSPNFSNLLGDPHRRPWRDSALSSRARLLRTLGSSSTTNTSGAISCTATALLGGRGRR